MNLLFSVSHVYLYFGRAHSSFKQMCNTVVYKIAFNQIFQKRVKVSSLWGVLLHKRKIPQIASAA